MKPQKNPILDLIVNIVLPVVLLNYLSKAINPTIALIIALSFPLGFGIYDYFKSHNKNIFSIFGFFNILLTGGLAIFEFEGFWFAVKEALIPLILGIVVLSTFFTKKTAFEWIFFNQHVFDIKTIEEKIKEYNTESYFQSCLKKCNILFSTSFFFSAVLNYFLAINIFTKIPPTLSEVERSVLLNEQIADMHWKSQFVIAVPLMIFTAFILWYFIHHLLKSIRLSFNDFNDILTKKLK